MATETTWLGTNATTATDDYQAMHARYRGDTATHIQWISHWQLRLRKLFADDQIVLHLHKLCSIAHC